MSDTTAPTTPAGEVIALRADDATTLVDRLDSIANVLTGLGTAGDKGAQARPDLRRAPLTLRELRCLYAFNGYAARFIDIVPDDCTRKGWDVLADEVGDTPGVDIMEGEDTRLGLTSKVGDAHRWGRLDGGAALLLVTDDAATRSGAIDALAQPLDLDAIEEVLNVVVLDGTEIQPFTFGRDPRDASFRLPETWLVTPGGRMASGSASTEIHTSRLIYFPGRKRTPSERFNTNNGLDDSVLEAAWDPIRNLTTTDQGAAILAQELKIDTLQVEGLAALATADEQLAFYESKIRAMIRSMSMLNMRILGTGDTFTSEAANVTGYRDLAEGARIALAAVLGIPQTILYGDSPGGLNADGSSARDIWDRAIASVQERIYRSRLERLYEVVFAAKQGPTKGTIPDTWSINFHPLDEPDEPTVATTRKTIAETDAIYIGAGVYDPEDVAESRFGERGYQADLHPIETPDDDIDVAGADLDLDGGLLAALGIGDEADADAAAATDPGAPPPDEGQTPAEVDLGPEPPPPPAANSALNGAQVTSAKSIVADVAAGLLPRESALAMLEVFFGLSSGDASRVLGPVGDTFTTKAAPGGPLPDSEADDEPTPDAAVPIPGAFPAPGAPPAAPAPAPTPEADEVEG